MSSSLAQSKVILAIDPGKTIGYCMAEVSDSGIIVLQLGQFFTGETWDPYGSIPLELVSEVDHVRMEDYIGNRPLNDSARHVLKMIGAFKLRCQVLGVSYSEHAPGTRSRFIKGGVEAIGESIGVHATDALAHLLREASDMGIDYKKVGVTWKK